MKFNDTDKMVAPNIWMSLSAIYTHKKTAAVLVEMIQKTLPEFRKLLDVPATVSFRVVPIKAKCTNGRYYDKSKVVEIDCRLKWAEGLEVLAHELVHAEQYHQGRLKKKYSTANGWIHSWNHSKSFNKGSTYTSYRNQPWEQEAWSRQAGLAEQVCQAMEKK